MKILKSILKKLNPSELSRELFVNELAIQDIQSHGLISTLLPNHLYTPFTSYSASPTMISHILNEIVLLGKKNIVEFGSGISTVSIANLIKLNGLDVNFISVDHDLTWQKQLSSIMKSQATVENVGLIHAKIVDVPEMAENRSKWYCRETLDSFIPEAVDLVIVDGPSFSIGSQSRYFALPYLADRLSEDFSIFLDDTFRIGEKQILSDWSELLNMESREFTRYAMLTTNTQISTTPIALSYNYKFHEYVKSMQNSTKFNEKIS